MKFTLVKGSYDAAPKDVVRIGLTTEPRGHAKFIVEKGIETLEIGVGKPEEMNLRRFRLLCRSIIAAAKAHKIKKIAVQFSRTPEIFKNLRSVISPEDISELATVNFEMANFEFNDFKTKPKEGWSAVEEIFAYTPELGVEKAIQRGKLIGEAVNACRTLCNTPANDMTPTLLAKAAKDAVKGLPVAVATLGVAEMTKLGMGAVLGVAKGSTEKPTFTVMEYKGIKGAPIVLVGKGVTFDAGGLNIKTPSSSMYEMHMDMSGAAAVISTVALAAKLKLKKHVIGIFPAVENLPGNAAYRPGDILTSLSGKTIEILDTDAEGRVILADALTYAKRFKPAAVIDIATLTGAAMSALGLHASALLTRDDALAKEIEASGERSGDYVWRLPLWDEYEERVKGTFADLKNVPGGATSRYGGAIDGGMFLWQFAKELNCPWAHLDIAPRMTSTKGDHLAEGAAGEPVRLLIDFIEHAVHDKN